MPNTKSNGLDEQKWKNECMSLASKSTPQEYREAVSTMKSSAGIYPYQRKKVVQLAFLEACFAEQKEHAQVILNHFFQNSDLLDIEGWNYSILKNGTLGALKVYSSLVDMNSLTGKNSDFLDICTPAIYGQIDKLNYCHEIGFSAGQVSHFYLLAVLISSSHFDSAKLYAKQHAIVPTVHEWDATIHKLAKNHEGRNKSSPVQRLEILKGIFGDLPICSYDPIKAVYSALGNNAVDVAQYFLDNGAPKYLLTSTESVSSIFNSKLGNGYIYSDVIEFLLKIGAKFSVEQIKLILLDQAHRKGGNGVIEKLLPLIKDEDVPWEGMLTNACLTHKSDVIDRVTHLSSLHAYTADNYQKTLFEIGSTPNDADLIETIQTLFGIK